MEPKKAQIDPQKQNKSKSQKTKKKNLQNEIYQFKWVNPKKLLRPYPNPYNSLTRPQKAQNDPQKQKKRIRKPEILQNESYQP